MHVLKGLVIGLGLLIAAGMALFAYGLYQKIADPEFTFFPAETGDAPPVAAVPPVAAAPGAFGTIAVPLPEGCVLARVIPEGDRLYLRIGPTGRCERVVVVDVATGSVLGTITVGP